MCRGGAGGRWWGGDTKTFLTELLPMKVYPFFLTSGKLYCLVTYLFCVFFSVNIIFSLGMGMFYPLLFIPLWSLYISWCFTLSHMFSFPLLQFLSMVLLVSYMRKHQSACRRWVVHSGFFSFLHYTYHHA